MPPVGSRRGFARLEAGAGVGFRLGIDALTGLLPRSGDSPSGLVAQEGTKPGNSGNSGNFLAARRVESIIFPRLHLRR